MAIWVPSLDIGGVLAMAIYSTSSTGTSFGLSVQSRLDPLLTLFGPRPILSISLSLRIFHHNSAKLTTSNVNESLNGHPHHAHSYILQRRWLLSARHCFSLLVKPPSVYAHASGIRSISGFFLCHYRCIISFNPYH
jgi:hypothetical protein